MKQSQGTLFSAWGSQGEAESINKASNLLPLNDDSQINPRNVDYRTLQTSFNIAKARNQLSPSEEAKVKEVIDKNYRDGSIDEKEKRVINLFNEISKDRTPQTQEPERKGSIKTSIKKDGNLTKDREEITTTKKNTVIPSKMHRYSKIKRGI